MSSKDLVTVHGLARILRLSAAWLIEEAEAERIPSLRAGRVRLFNPQAVEAALARRASRQPPYRGARS